MSTISTRRDRHVTVTLKDGSAYNGRLYMSVSTAGGTNASGSQPRKFLYLQIGDDRKIVRFNVSDILKVMSIPAAHTA
jgi:hypothetical protein